MKRVITFLTPALLFILTYNLSAQNFTNPVEYLNYVNQESASITKDVWSYMKASAHSNSARKIEKRRESLIETIYKAQRQVGQSPGYKGDIAYRNALHHYLKLNHTVLKEDFAKIVDLEAIAEQSYDLMEAYILAKEEAYKKLDAAQEELQREQETFAAKYGVNIVESTNKKEEKIEKASLAFNYYHKVYLIFFKSYKQEVYLMEALSTDNIGTIEQNLNALKSLTEEGLGRLDTLPRFGSDLSLKVELRNMLNFYLSEAGEYGPKIVDYFLTREKFNEMKAAFDAKKSSQRTKEDIDQYNKGVDEINRAVNEFNRSNDQLNKRRAELLDRWNKAVDNFFSVHVP